MSRASALVVTHCAVCGGEIRRPRRDVARCRYQVCSKDCADEAQRGQVRERPREGRIIRDGYVYRRVPRDHPLASTIGYAPEHLLVAEDVLGRPLRPHERVRRLASGDRQDNRPAVLFVEWIDPDTGEAKACGLLELARTEHGEG